MEYRSLGHSGLKVSPLCLGTMMFGDRTEETVAQRIVDKGLDFGVNFIDTADVYSFGASEEMTGRTISEHRNHWVLATKVANPMGQGPNQRGLSRQWIMKACEDSLRRLKSDHIDIYYLHKEDHSTPLLETVNAIGDLQKSGKIRYFGVSNHRSWRVAEICNLCDGLGIDRPIVSQPYYNAINRMPETEHIPACDYYGLGIAAYSPVARGVLTGKYIPGQDPSENTRAGRNDRRIMQTEWREESLIIAQTVKAHAELYGMSPVQFATLWVLNNAMVTSAIAGPRTEEQWDDYLGIFDQKFSKEDEALIDRLVAEGHSSTPGYNDPAYPLEGRIALTD
ncbi:MAG: aryl-alcohol dehydrogenase-like predicted oxidoreductase [Oceanicoccus sp.]|jgi:aryl-alcohol dehydrogenase-like predicted oxidoreductase